MVTYLQKHGGAPLDHPRRCQAYRHDGNPCRRYAIRGGFVCRVHGGSAPQVVAKARERLALAADHNVRNLLGLADTAENEQVRLSATNSALDRAGLSAKAQVEVEVAVKQPWEEMMMDFARASRERQAALERGDIIDAEVVEDPGPGASDRARSRIADADADTADAAVRTAGHVGERAGRPAWAEDAGPQPRHQLEPEEDAVVETARANRSQKARKRR